jgi:hypothetical protein
MPDAALMLEARRGADSDLLRSDDGNPDWGCFSGIASDSWHMLGQYGWRPDLYQLQLIAPSAAFASGSSGNPKKEE